MNNNTLMKKEALLAKGINEDTHEDHPFVPAAFCVRRDGRHPSSGQRAEPLWEMDLSGKWFAACPEYQGKYKPFGDLYYNAGVMVLNLAQMREDGIEQKLVAYLKAFRQPWADQDAWNKYALEQDKAVAFDVRYNENQMTGTTDQPAIIHYCAIHDWCENKGIPRREYLDKYM